MTDHQTCTRCGEQVQPGDVALYDFANPVGDHHSLDGREASERQ